MQINAASIPGGGKLQMMISFKSSSPNLLMSFFFQTPTPDADIAAPAGAPGEASG